MMSVWVIASTLILEAAVIVAALSVIALGHTPWLSGELQTVVVCSFFGGLGGVTYCLRGVYLNACVHKTWNSTWLPWYFIRPFVSLILGGISYLFVKSGLLLLGAIKNPDASELGIWAAAFLAGLNVDKFLTKIETVGHTVWGIEPSRQSKPDPEEMK